MNLPDPPLLQAVAGAGLPRHALLSYILEPFVNGPHRHHQNQLQAIEISQVLAECGYQVDASSYLDQDRIRADRPYDLVVSLLPWSPDFWERVGGPATVRIGYGTESNPEFNNDADRKRQEMLLARRGFSFEAPRLTRPFPREAMESLDHWALVGNGRTLSTYDGFRLRGATLVPNTGGPRTVDEDLSGRRRNRFAFVGSGGQVHRGLDWALEFFASRPDLELFVFSPFEEEKAFCEAYRRELRETPNIRAVGFVDVFGPEFLGIASTCRFLLYPSCAEGMSGSVLTGMAAGLVPVVTPECGFPESEVVLLQGNSPEAMADAVGRALSTPDPVLDAMVRRNWSLSETKYGMAAFRSAWKNAVQAAERERTSRMAASPSPRIIPSRSDRPLVSAIVSTYNAASMLPACLEDLRGQTIADRLEVVVVDSGSTQDEKGVVDSFRGRLPLLKYVRTPRESLYAAWNRGLQLATGRYVTNANTDDAHRADALEILAASLDAHPEADLAFADCLWTDRANDTWDRTGAERRRISYPDYHPATTLFWCTLGPHPVWRRTLFDRIGGFDPSFKAAGDLEFQLRFTMAGCSAVHVPEALSLFCQNTEGLSLADSTSLQEQRLLFARARNTAAIARLYQVDPDDPEAVSRAWTALGHLALRCQIPWGELVAYPDFALECFERAARLSGGNVHARACAVEVGRLMGTTPSIPDLAGVPPVDATSRPADPAPAVPPLRWAPTSPAARPSTTSGTVVAIDARTLFFRDSVDRGIGQYTLHHLTALAQARPDWRFRLLTSTTEGRERVSRLLDLPNVETAPWTPNSAQGADLYHVPDPMGRPYLGEDPFALSLPGRTSAVFYDIIPRRIYWEGTPEPLREMDRSCHASLARSASTVLCISEHTRRDLLEVSEIEPSRTRVILAGRNGSDSPSGTVDLGALRSRFGILPDYFLHVGSVDPHKNLATALRAFQTARASRPCTLVVAGRKMPSHLAAEKAVREAGMIDVVFTDFLSSEELDTLYRGAVATLFLSRYEGFGFPVLEAMARGCPVIASDSSSIPEVGGDATLSRTPDDFEGVARDMLRLLEEPALRGDLSRRGLERSREFSWDKAARRTLEAWDDLLQGSAREVRAIDTTAEVQWISPIWDPSGYADESRGFLRHLAASGPRISTSPWGRHSESFRSSAEPALRAALDPLHDRPVREGAPVVLAMPAHALGRVRDRGHHVGRTTFETDGLPPEWVARCNAMDEIWVPCGFNRETFAKAGVTRPILVVPEGVDTDRFRPGMPPLPLPGPERGTTFLAVFEWTHRKGPDALLRAWAEAFGPSDDVRLVLRTYPPNQIEGDPLAWVENRIDEELSRIGRRRSDCAPIAAIARQVPDSDMPRLYAAADVFVAPSRGEGWGRPHQEAMSCGVPVVATRWSGNLEFQDDTNSWLIDTEGLREIDSREEFPFYRGQKWAEPSVRHLAALLREAASRPDLRRTKGEKARADMVGKWDWKRIAPLAETRLREILQGVPADRSALARPASNSAPMVARLLPRLRGRIPIAMPAYNRDRYLREVLEGLRACRDLDRFFIVTGEEPGCPGTAALFDAVDWMPIVRRRHTQKQGCNANVLGTLDAALEMCDRAVSLEDDVVPAPDFLSFVRWGLDRFRNDREVFNLTGYNRQDAVPPREWGALARKNAWFTPWGWATWRDRMERFHSEVDVPSTGNVSWDAFVCEWSKGVRGYKEVHPVVGRIQNIGEEGTWVPSADWHRENQRVRHWAGNLGWDPVSREEFRMDGEGPQALLSPSADLLTREEAAPAALRFCGQLFNFSGYARLSREAVAGLMDADARVTVDPLLNDPEWFKGISLQDRSRWTELLQRRPEAGTLVCCDVPRDAHGRNELFQQMEEANPGCARKAAWTMFETDRLPQGWADSLNRMDEVWVPSEFNRRTFARSGVDASRIHVVPGGIDTTRYANARPMDLPGHHRGTTFLSVFQWVRRKGWDVLLRAWAQAFDPKADVRLVLRCHPFGKAPSEMRRIFGDSLRELGLTESGMAPVVLLDGFVPESELPSLYAASDVFVLPSRGEGWGLPYLEALSAGKPCIATAWGACLDFLTDDCAWLVPPRDLVPVGDEACRENPYLAPDHRWADPDPAEVARLLRVAASDVELRLRKSIKALEISARWSHHRTAQAILDRLRPEGRPPVHPASPVLSASSNRRLTGALEKVAQGLLADRAVAHRPASAPQGETAPTSLSVRWEGSQFLHHSLAHVNRELCLRLAKRGHDLSILPFEPDQFGPEGDPDLSILAKLHGAPLEGECQVHVRHQWPPNLEAPAEGKWVVVQPWEFGSPPSDWMVPFRDQVDEIWCYTEHVRRTYLEAGIPADRLRVVPLGVDADRFRPGLDPLPGLERDPSRTTFLFVGGTIARKGFDVLLNAWREAFDPDAPVRLVVKDMGGKTTYKGQTGESMVEELNASGKSAPVLYFDEDLSPADLPRVYACADVLVHPYRGEGFGLPVAEAMSCGLPVIVTRGGSTDDFCSDAESWGIPAGRSAVPGGRVGPFETVAAPWWLEPSLADLVATLRAVAKAPASRRSKGDAARERILSGWTWDHAARVAEAALVEIASRPSPRRNAPAPALAIAAVTQVAQTPPTRVVPSEETLESLNRILFRAEAATARGDLVEAEDATREAVERHPDVPLAWLARAMILRGLGKIPQAAQSVQKSLSLDLTPEALLESVQVHRLAGRKDLAKDHEKLLKKQHAPWLAATKAIYAQKGQAWPLDAAPKATRKTAAPPLKRR